MTKRTDRVNVLLRQELGGLIQRELKDPRLGHGLISVTEVATSRDLGHAVVYVSYLGSDGELGEVIAALTDAAHYLQIALRSAVKLRQIPALKFEFDPSIERGAHLTQVIENLNPPPSDA
jgi:ribosome-binding factor A